MKTIALHLLSAVTLVLAIASTSVQAHEANEAGPNGGRLLKVAAPHAEFLVTADRKVRITFLDKDDKPVPPSGQVVIVTTGARSAPVRLTFSRDGDTLISDTALPAGNNHPTVVQIKPTPEAKPAVERFNLNLSLCPECSNAEYACTCTH